MGNRAMIALFISMLCSYPAMLGGRNSREYIIEKAADPLGNDISGDRQIGIIGEKLGKPFLVSIKDEEDHPAKQIKVVFSVLNDSTAVCNPRIATSDEHGYARTTVTTSKRTGEFIVEAAIRTEPSKRILLTYTVFNRQWVYLLLMQLIGGFALFFFGFRVAGKGLTKSVGGGLRELLYRFTRNRFWGMISGVLLAFLLQSSTAANVMIVGFVTAGLVSLLGALSVAIGAAVGTTLTVQLIAFKVYNYALLIVAIGFLLNSLKRPVRYYGQFILGFGLIFLGIKFMGEAFVPLSIAGTLEQFFIAFKEHPFGVFVISALFAALIHSSAATIGIVISLSFQGIIQLEHALPVVVGANLGMSATALLASIRGNREARMFAVGNFVFKIATAMVFLPFLGFWTGFIARSANTVSRQIANSHTCFNAVLAILFLPFLVPVKRMLDRLVPMERRELRKGPRFLDWNIIDNPAAAIAHAHREILRMCDTVLGMFSNSIVVFKNNDKDLMRDIVKKDDEVDTLEEEIDEYLTRISQEELTEYQSKRIASLFFITDELEHIGDIVSKSLMVYAEKKIQQGFMFSSEGFKEIIAFHKQVEEHFRLTLDALTTYDKELAERIRAERKKGMDIHITLHNAHIDRLKRGLVESIETSTVHLDLINDLERINFHLSNIGYAILGKMLQK
jgi:phosphate:Na+ symporter